MRESQDAGDVGRGAQVTIENDVRIDRERRCTGTKVAVEEWVTPGGNRFWELRMRVAVEQPKVHPDRKLSAEGISPSHKCNSDREPARAPRPVQPSVEQDREPARAPRLDQPSAEQDSENRGYDDRKPE